MSHGPDRLKLDDISNDQKHPMNKINNSCQVHVMLYRSCVQPSLFREKHRPDTREWWKLILQYEEQSLQFSQSHQILMLIKNVIRALQGPLLG